MSNVKFGKSGLKGKTPTWVKWIYRCAGLASALWVVVSGSYPEIPEHVQLNILKAIGLANSVIYTLCQFAGYAEIDPTEEIYNSVKTSDRN